MLNEILDLYDFNRWANRRILNATASLEREAFVKDMGNSFPSIRDTLVHILGAEWIWLERWKGVSPTSLPAPDDFTTQALLEIRWRDVEANQELYLEKLTEPELDEVIAYRNTEGRRFAYPLWQMLRHVVNHSTYHRGQVITMLRQLQTEPVSTDLLLYCDERAIDGEDEL